MRVQSHKSVRGHNIGSVFSGALRNLTIDSLAQFTILSWPSFSNEMNFDASSTPLNKYLASEFINNMQSTPIHDASKSSVTTMQNTPVSSVQSQQHSQMVVMPQPQHSSLPLQAYQSHVEVSMGQQIPLIYQKPSYPVPLNIPASWSMSGVQQLPYYMPPGEYPSPVYNNSSLSESVVANPSFGTSSPQPPAYFVIYNPPPGQYYMLPPSYSSVPEVPEAKRSVSRTSTYHKSKQSSPSSSPEFETKQRSSFVGRNSQRYPNRWNGKMPDSKKPPLQYSERQAQRKLSSISYSTNILYKTEVCRDYASTEKQTGQGSCPRGSTCQFAHGMEELHDPRSHSLYKTAFCADYRAEGKCPRGDACFHVHDPSEMRTRSILKVPQKSQRSISTSELLDSDDNLKRRLQALSIDDKENYLSKPPKYNFIEKASAHLLQQSGDINSNDIQALDMKLTKSDFI